MRVFTTEELKNYDGKKNPAYVAYRGKVYDVSRSFHWQKGLHQAQHPAGNDLTEALEKAPHGTDMLDRFPVVGTLGEGSSKKKS